VSECAFGVLGPLQIAGQTPDLPRQAQVLLGVLLLRANEVVSPLRLSDEIWGERPPASGTNAVQVYVSKLRKTIETAGVAAAVTRHPGGYVLEVDSHSVDWLVFASALDEAARARASDPERSAALLHDALALWRGPALAGLTFESVTATEIAQLEESRLVAIERRIEHDLELGRHLEAAAELPALIAEHPFRESFRSKLVLALYRSGRQADALDECRRAGRFLRDELGLEPSAALRELEQAILRQDPALAPAPPRPKAAPARAEGRRRPVAVVYLSLDDEALDGRDPELAERVIANWTRELTATLERHGADVVPGSPGEVAAAFGLAAAREDDALRACRAALDALRAHATTSASAEAGLGVRGCVEVGEAVERAGREPGIAATLARRARRLADTAAQGEILLGDGALQLVRENVEASGERALTAVRAAAEAIPRHLARPLVGRRGELDAVRRRVAECVDWSLPGLTVLVGPAGIGKSRLAAEIVAQAAARAGVLRARCLPDEQGVAYAPLRGVVERLLSTHGPAGLATLAGDDEPAATAARFLAITGDADVASTREETFLAVRRIFEGLARELPLVLLVEDLHWAEPAFVDLLLDVAGVGTGSIAIVATARPDLLEGRPELAAEHPR
jgi:DNA-binding SARP family transcriptional activator